MPKRKDQTTSKPEGWRETSCVRQVSLTHKQTRYARQAEGIGRSVYNSAVEAGRLCRKYGVRKRLADGKVIWPTANDMAREFNAIKEAVSPWVVEVSKFVTQGAFADYQVAVRQWYKAISQTTKQGHCSVHGRSGRKDGKPCSGFCGQPKFHRKKATGAGGFLAAAGISCIKYDGGRRIKLPYIGSVKMTRPLPPDFIPVNVRIKRNNGRWYASIAGYAPPLPRTAADSQSAVGVDTGIQPLAVSVDSDGVVVQYLNPKAFYAAQRKLARWQRALARRTPGSRGWWIAQRRIDKIQRHIIGLRANVQHHISKIIAAGYSVVGIETLNVAGMDKMRWQAKAVRDAGIGELLRQIRYKAEWYGAALVSADQWYASSKICSACGVKNAALRREPEWTCPHCGVHHDRNVNAARNLLKLALGAVCASTPGEEKALAEAVSAPAKLSPEEKALAEAVSAPVKLSLMAATAARTSEGIVNTSESQLALAL